MHNLGIQILVLTRLRTTPQTVEDIEYLPTSEPEQNYPPSSEISQKSGASPVEQTTEREEENHKENPQDRQFEETETSQKPQQKIHQKH